MTATMIDEGAVDAKRVGTERIEAEAKRPGNAVRVKVATHNAGARPKRLILLDLLEQAPVLNMQEMADQTPEDFALAPWVGMYWPGLDNKAESRNVNENPILWDQRTFRLHRSGSRLLTERTPVGDKGAGGDVMHVKWLNWVALRHVALDEVMVFGNVHTVPSILANSARSRLMRTQIDGCCDWTKRRSQKRIVTLSGDFNANALRRAEDDFLDPLRRVGLRSCWDETGHRGGSMGKRQIDYVWLREHDRAHFEGMDVPPSGFDHHPVIVTLRINPRGARR